MTDQRIVDIIKVLRTAPRMQASSNGFRFAGKVSDNPEGTVVIFLSHTVALKFAKDLEDACQIHQPAES